MDDLIEWRKQTQKYSQWLNFYHYYKVRYVLGKYTAERREVLENMPPFRQSRGAEHLSPNVSTSVRIFGSAEVRHTTMGTLSGF